MAAFPPRLNHLFTHHPLKNLDMNFSQYMRFCLALFGIAPSGVSADNHAVIAISPYLGEITALNFKSALHAHLLMEAKPGTVYTLLDGANGQLITRLQIPLLRRDSLNARLRKLEAELGVLESWINRPLPFPDLKDSGTLNPPAVVAAMERHEAGILLLVGSPIYRNAELSIHNWHHAEGELAGYWYPTDAHFYAPPGHSPWVIETERQRLRDVRLHWLALGPDTYPKGVYQTNIIRFYRLFAQLQGGALVSFQRKPQEALQTLFRTDLTSPTHYIDANQTRIEMRRAEDHMRHRQEAEQAVTEIELPRHAPTRQAAWRRSLTMKQSPSVRAGHGDVGAMAESVMEAMAVDTPKGEVGIALGWDAPVDFDLVVYPAPEKEPLYFGNRQSRDGRYLKDMRTPERFQYEEVILNKPGNEVEAWVNLHSVDSPLDSPPSGEYYIAVDRVIYTGHFSFGVTRGNLGEGLERRTNSPFWVKLDLSRLQTPRPKAEKDVIH